MYGIGRHRLDARGDRSRHRRPPRAATAWLLSEVADGVALTRWSPLPGVRIDTALVRRRALARARPPRSSTDRDLALSETGFALPWEPEGFGPTAPGDARRAAGPSRRRRGAASTIVDLRTGDVRTHRRAAAPLSPNANMMQPHTIVPALDVTVPAGDAPAGVRGRRVPRRRRGRARSAPLPSRPTLLDRLDAFAARPDPRHDRRTARRCAPAARSSGISAVLLPFTADGASTGPASSRCSHARSRPGSSPR